jgi:hypothetical protein
MNKNIYAGNITDVLITITLEIWVEHYNNLHLLTKIIWWNAITPLFGYSLTDVVMENFNREYFNVYYITLFGRTVCSDVCWCIGWHSDTLTDRSERGLFMDYMCIWILSCCYIFSNTCMPISYWLIAMPSRIKGCYRPDRCYDKKC